MKLMADMPNTAHTTNSVSIYTTTHVCIDDSDQLLAKYIENNDSGNKWTTLLLVDSCLMATKFLRMDPCRD